MANLIASPTQMAYKLQEVENKLEELDLKIMKLQAVAEAQLETLKAKNGKKTKKNDKR